MGRQLSEMAQWVRERKLNVYGISEILDGEEKSEKIVDAPWSTDLYSVSKFVSSAAVGLAYDEGKLDINAPITQLIKNCPEPKEPKWKAVTLHNCLRHRTGLINGNLDIDNEKDEGIEDWLDYILALPLEAEPETERHYTDAAFYLACRAVESAVGENVFSYLHRKLFRPLHFRECSWSVCPDGFVTGGSGFCTNDRDLARLGWLWVNGGVYEGQQLLSEEYIKLSLENGYGIDKREEYPECYYKTGMAGQFVFMLPQEKRCIALRGYYSSDDRTELVDHFLTEIG